MKATGAVVTGWRNLRRGFTSHAAYDFNRLTQQPLLSQAEIASLMREAYLVTEATLHRPEVQFRHVGDMRSTYLGQGLDFEESRLYQRGDDLRSMDWRTTARTGKAYVKVFHEEHQAALHVIVDRSASMRFATQGRLKAAQAARVAILAAFSAVRKGASVGGSVVQPERRFIPSATGQAGAVRLAQAVGAAAPPLENAPDVFNLSQTLESLEPILARGTKLVIISDYHGFEQVDLDLISRFAFRYEVRPIVIVDPAEVTLPHVGVAHFSSATGAASMWLDTHDSALQRRFSEQSVATNKRLKTLFESIGIELQSCLTTADQLPRV